MGAQARHGHCHGKRVTENSFDGESAICCPEKGNNQSSCSIPPEIRARARALPRKVRKHSWKGASLVASSRIKIIDFNGLELSGLTACAHMMPNICVQRLPEAVRWNEGSGGTIASQTLLALSH